MGVGGEVRRCGGSEWLLLFEEEVAVCGRLRVSDQQRATSTGYFTAATQLDKLPQECCPRTSCLYEDSAVCTPMEYSHHTLAPGRLA